jgi:hypothetical protein
VFPELNNYLSSVKTTKEKIAKRQQRKRKKELDAKAALRKKELAVKAALRKLQRKRKKRKEEEEEKKNRMEVEEA